MANAVRVRLGKVVRALRVKRGWRQIDLAAHSGVNKTMICDLERGERDFCLKTLDALAEALDTVPSELLKSAGR
jgi:transcriptional regulator with XRE-family HTH domain